MMRFAPGARVERRLDVFDNESSMRTGTVIRAYSEMRPARPASDLPELHYPELYDVLWDDGQTGHAYLRHGIDHIKEKAASGQASG